MYHIPFIHLYINKKEISAHPINQGEGSFLILQKIYTFVP